MDYEKFLSVSYNPAMQGREQEYTSFLMPHWGVALPVYFTRATVILNQEMKIAGSVLPQFIAMYFFPTINTAFIKYLKGGQQPPHREKRILP